MNAEAKVREYDAFMQYLQVQLITSKNENDRLLKNIEMLKKKETENDVDAKLARFEERVAANLEEKMSAKLNEQEANHLREKKEMQDQLEVFKKEIEKKLAAKKDETEQVTLYCHDCDSVLPNDLREDGVSVSCKCKRANIVVDLKEGFKWMYISAPDKIHGWCQHYLQLDIGTKNGSIVKCKFCGTEGPCIDASVNLGLSGLKFMKSVEKNSHANVEKMNKLEAKVESLIEQLKTKEERHQQQLTRKQEEHQSAMNSKNMENIALKKDIRDMLAKIDEGILKMTEPFFKCTDCKSLLPRTLGEDGVTTSCNKCNKNSIVGKLKEGNKWIVVEVPNDQPGWCRHVLQVPVDIKSGEIVKCEICNTEGPCREVNRVALMMTAGDMTKERDNDKLEELMNLAGKCSARLNEKRVNNDFGMCHFM